MRVSAINNANAITKRVVFLFSTLYYERVIVVKKFIMRLNFRTKQGMIHRTSCGYTKSRNRLIDSGYLLDNDQTGWFGPWDTYNEAKAKADLLSEFKIWDCSICRQISHMYDH